MADWTKQECRAIVEDYFDMLFNELRRQKYSKTDHRRNLLGSLNSRSEGSIEFKHQNISAVLTDLDQMCIDGYKPMANYQLLLKEVVIEKLAEERQNLAAISEDSSIELEADASSRYWQEFFRPAPELVKPTHRDYAHTREHHGNYSVAVQDSAFKALGDAGEKFVLDLERERLSGLKRPDLAAEIEWTSREKGDGKGYDIRSFNADTETELFIEVKTTRFSRYTPFYISANEVDFSRSNADHYALYRVFNFGAATQLFQLPGNVDSNTNLDALNYRARFS